MKWCNWCGSYHGPKANHIARRMYLLPMSYDGRKENHLLFKTKARAREFGYNNPAIKVEVIPIK